MQNRYGLTRRILSLLPLTISLLFFSFSLFSQNGTGRIAQWIEGQRVTGSFPKVDMLQALSEAHSAAFSNTVSNATVLQLEQSMFDELRAQPLPSLTLHVPSNFGDNFDLELARVSVLAPNFKVGTLGVDAQEDVSYSPGIFYRGVVKGKPNSLATLAIFENEIVAMVSDETGNYELTRVQDGSGVYLLYRSGDVKDKPGINCFTEEGEAEPVPSVTDRSTGCKVVQVYFECDYKLYQDKGSNTTNVVNYVTSFFNQVAILYANEFIDVDISEIYVWTSVDPYATMTTTSAVLTAFHNTRGANFNGNLAHFLTTRNLGGGIAYLDVLCNKANAHGVSMIYNTFSNVPTYSWTVEVVTHELGHNFGSWHTHSCNWSGGALDDCYTPEGSCSTGPHPTNGGTIMSYCHLNSTGINFNNGFGTQPGNRIRSKVTACTSLSASPSTPPTGLTSSNLTNTTATVSWDPIGVSSYTVEYKPTTSSTWISAGTTTATTLSLSGLTAGTTYDWHVKTDCSVFSSTANFTTTGTGSSCAAPLSLSVSNITANSAVVIWLPVIGATSYTVEYKASTSGTWISAGTTTATTLGLTGLSAGTGYDWHVKANCSAFSVTATFTTTSSACSAPTGLSSSNITTTSATVSWAAVSGATSYIVEYKASTSGTWINAGTTSTTSMSLSGLASGTSYDWHVQANCSAFSATATFTTTSSSCSAPTGLSSSGITTSSATVSWGAVSGATMYSVEYKASTSGTWISAGNTSSTSLTLSGLASGTAYDWHVRANCSVYSATATFTTTSAGCSAPIGLSASGITTSSANVSWAAVSGATSYTVEYKASTSGTWISAGTTSSTSLTLSGLASGTSYDWHVKANCSSFSATATFTTNSAGCTAPSGLGSSGITTTSANVSWGAVSGATSYSVEYKASSSGTWISAGTTSSTSLTLSGLASGTSYDWHVKTNCSAFSATATFTTVNAPTCSAPSGLSATSVTANSALLSWLPVSGATSYTVEYKVSTSSTWIWAGTTANTSLSLINLLGGTTYSWHVKASCSNYSADATFTTTGTTSCSVPTGLTNVNIMGHSAVVSWNTVPGAANYTVQKRVYGSPYYTTVGTYTATSTTLTGLNTNTTYYWRVKANCSDYSNAISFSTPSSLIAPGEEELTPTLHIFPNPTEGDLTLDFNGSLETAAQVRVTDASGRLLFSEQLSQPRQTMNMASLQAGVYFLILEQNSHRVSVQRFVKM